DRVLAVGHVERHAIEDAQVAKRLREAVELDHGEGGRAERRKGGTRRGTLISPSFSPPTLPPFRLSAITATPAPRTRRAPGSPHSPAPPRGWWPRRPTAPRSWRRGPADTP